MQNIPKENNSSILIKENELKIDSDNANKEIINNSINQSIKNESGLNNIINQNSPNNLPNIEYFFVLKNKLLLVDSDKTLWHLKKCNKFDQFTKLNLKQKFNDNKDENLTAFLEFYQNEIKDKVPSVINDVSKLSINENSVEHDHFKDIKVGTSDNIKITENLENPKNEKERESSFVLSDSN